MSLRKITLAALLILGINLPAISSAGDLTIANHTQFDSTSIINGAACSTILGEGGITRAGKTSVIPESRVTIACLYNTTNCTADVYMTAYCNSKGDLPVATIILDTKKGVKSIQMKNKSYTITGSGFTITLSSLAETNKK
jgi:hypothetical protein